MVNNEKETKNNMIKNYKTNGEYYIIEKYDGSKEVIHKDKISEQQIIKEMNKQRILADETIIPNNKKKKKSNIIALPILIASLIAGTLSVVMLPYVIAALGLNLFTIGMTTLLGVLLYSTIESTGDSIDELIDIRKFRKNLEASKEFILAKEKELLKQKDNEVNKKELQKTEEEKENSVVQEKKEEKISATLEHPSIELNKETEEPITDDNLSVKGKINQYNCVPSNYNLIQDEDATLLKVGIVKVSLGFLRFINSFTINQNIKREQNIMILNQYLNLLQNARINKKIEKMNNKVKKLETKRSTL